MKNFVIEFLESIKAFPIQDPKSGKLYYSLSDLSVFFNTDENKLFDEVCDMKLSDNMVVKQDDELYIIESVVYCLAFRHVEIEACKTFTEKTVNFAQSNGLIYDYIFR